MNAQGGGLPGCPSLLSADFKCNNPWGKNQCMPNTAADNYTPEECGCGTQFMDKYNKGKWIGRKSGSYCDFSWDPVLPGSCPEAPGSRITTTTTTTTLAPREACEAV